MPATTGTTVSTENFQVIELFSLNDFHGGAYTDISTIAKIGEYLQYKKSSTDHSIIVASGDIFQGTAISNYYYGLPLVDAMNEIGFDAFTLGNHEFDWGIEKIHEYHDGNPDNGEAEYAVLAANIVEKSTGLPLPWTQPYKIIDINGVKVGVIGVIGDVINSISASRVENIEFLDAATTVYNYASILRTEEDCDVVVVSLHEYDYAVNEQIASFSGDHLVDAMFNGHTHTSVADMITRSGASMPYAQISNYSNSLLAKITLVYDRSQQKITGAQAEILDEYQLSFVSPSVQAIIDEYATDPDYVSFVSQVLANSGGYFDRYDLAPWGSSVIRDYLGLDFGMVNAGGFRTAMSSGEVTMGEFVVIYPFDNYIKTNQMTGQQLTEFYQYVMDYQKDVVFDDGVSYDDFTDTLYKDGVAVEPTELYTVGAVDYIFDKTNYAFLDGLNIETTTFLMRDLLVQDLLNTAVTFNPANGTSYSPLVPQTYYYDFSELKNRFSVI